MAIRPGTRCRRALGIGVLVAVAVTVRPLVSFASDGDAAGDASPDGAQPAPPVGLDALFRLPSQAEAGGRAPEGTERQRWEQKFTAARAELNAARESLARAQQELEQMASKTENWQMSAPGARATAENSPVSYKLRQEIRDQREEVDRAERRLRDLEVEASLAGVPAEWRRPAHEDAVPGS